MADSIVVRIPRIKPEDRERLVKGALLTLVLVLGFKMFFGEAPSLRDIVFIVPGVAGLFAARRNASRGPPVERNGVFRSPRTALVGGLVGGTLGGIAMAVLYYSQAVHFTGPSGASHRHLVTACALVVPYGALIGCVGGSSVSVCVLIADRIPVLGSIFGRIIGALLGGMLAGAVLGIWGGLTFGRNDLPLAPPWLTIICTLVGSAVIVSSVFLFEHSGRWTSAIVSGAVSIFFGSLLLVAAGWLVGIGRMERMTGLFDSNEAVSLAIAGCGMGAIAGAFGGALIWATAIAQPLVESAFKLRGDD